MEFQIRHAHANDSTILAEAGRRLFETAFAADNQPEDMDAYLAESFSPDIQAQELADPASLTLIAETNGRFAGYARLKEGRPGMQIPGEQAIELVRIYAERDYIGMGAGSALMQACLEEAARRGFDSVWLGVWEKNRDAIRFYEKWGFSVMGTQPFKLGEDIQRDFVMQRSIGR
jgi:diamine N-acetyltransferase